MEENNYNQQPIPQQNQQQGGNYQPPINNVPPQKVKKPIYKKWWFWLIIVFVVLVIISAAGGSDDTTESESITGNATATANLIQDKYSIELKDATVVSEDGTNEKVLVVTYVFKNYDSEAAAFGYTFSDKAYVDGVECEDALTSYGIEGYDFDSYWLEIKQDAEVEVQNAFYIDDDTEHVDIEIYDYWETSDEPYVTLSIDV